MKREFTRWWRRFIQRRAAARRSADVGRYGFDPSYRHSAFGKPRFGRFETRFPLRQWLRRAGLAALGALAGWILWQSWLGLRIFAN